ncbi:hypothetical protein ACE1TI_04940 [Alteribacillus sp. JSM 102045]|uniref:hypothetical protein n=1 Tax=Alteribacillus sp. JSM 102045 TaxID=1562101 RepID=UPI0035C077F6
MQTVEDIQGLDIQTLENTLHMNLWEKLGAISIPIRYGELCVALGTVNGQENPVGNVVNSTFNEVQKYIIYNASPFMLSNLFGIH